MELRKRRSVSVFGGALFALGVFVLLCMRIDGPWSIVRAVIWGGGGVLLGAVLVAYGRRPFRFRIDPDGLTVRTKGINRLVPWDSIEAIIIDQPTPSKDRRTPSPQLLLVPVEGVDLGLPMTARSHAYDGDCLVLLDLDEVKESPEQVTAGLAQYAGHRLINALQLRQDRLAQPDFTIVLRGYDMVAVDALVREGQDVLAAKPLNGPRRIAARLKIDGARNTLPAALRGYDRQQVDIYLRDLSTELATLNTDPKPPSPDS